MKFKHPFKVFCKCTPEPEELNYNAPTLILQRKEAQRREKIRGAWAHGLVIITRPKRGRGSSKLHGACLNAAAAPDRPLSWLTEGGASTAADDMSSFCSCPPESTPTASTPSAFGQSNNALMRLLHIFRTFDEDGDEHWNLRECRYWGTVCVGSIMSRTEYDQWCEDLGASKTEGITLGHLRQHYKGHAPLLNKHFAACGALYHDVAADVVTASDRADVRAAVSRFDRKAVPVTRRRWAVVAIRGIQVALLRTAAEQRYRGRRRELLLSVVDWIDPCDGVVVPVALFPRKSESSVRKVRSSMAASDFCVSEPSLGDSFCALSELSVDVSLMPQFSNNLLLSPDPHVPPPAYTALFSNSPEAVSRLPSTTNTFFATPPASSAASGRKRGLSARVTVKPDPLQDPFATPPPETTSATHASGGGGGGLGGVATGVAGGSSGAAARGVEGGAVGESTARVLGMDEASVGSTCGGAAGGDGGEQTADGTQPEEAAKAEFEGGSFRTVVGPATGDEVGEGSCARSTTASPSMTAHRNRSPSSQLPQAGTSMASLSDLLARTDELLLTARKLEQSTDDEDDMPAHADGSSTSTDTEEEEVEEYEEPQTGSSQLAKSAGATLLGSTWDRKHPGIPLDRARMAESGAKDESMYTCIGSPEAVANNTNNNNTKGGAYQQRRMSADDEFCAQSGLSLASLGPAKDAAEASDILFSTPLPADGVGSGDHHAEDSQASPDADQVAITAQKPSGSGEGAAEERTAEGNQSDTTLDSQASPGAQVVFTAQKPSGSGDGAAEEETSKGDPSDSPLGSQASPGAQVVITAQKPSGSSNGTAEEETSKGDQSDSPLGSQASPGAQVVIAAHKPAEGGDQSDSPLGSQASPGAQVVIAAQKPAEGGDQSDSPLGSQASPGAQVVVSAQKPSGSGESAPAEEATGNARDRPGGSREPAEKQGGVAQTAGRAASAGKGSPARERRASAPSAGGAAKPAAKKVKKAAGAAPPPRRLSTPGESPVLNASFASANSSFSGRTSPSGAPLPRVPRAASNPNLSASRKATSGRHAAPSAPRPPFSRSSSMNSSVSSLSPTPLSSPKPPLVSRPAAVKKVRKQSLSRADSMASDIIGGSPFSAPAGSPAKKKVVKKKVKSDAD
ncbi:hypothetical protein DIPPA_09637 [Diplonema papillatum]|nr:hypothetical protein DIPPA_09637 [Diplonema papillatum]